MAASPGSSFCLEAQSIFFVECSQERAPCEPSNEFTSAGSAMTCGTNELSSCVCPPARSSRKASPAGIPATTHDPTTWCRPPRPMGAWYSWYTGFPKHRCSPDAVVSESRVLSSAVLANDSKAAVPSARTSENVIPAPSRPNRGFATHARAPLLPPMLLSAAVLTAVTSSSLALAAMRGTDDGGDAGLKITSGSPAWNFAGRR